MWEGGFRDQLASQVSSITVGPCTAVNHFTGPVIGRPAFDKITGIISKAKEAGGEILAGGKWDDSKGYFIEPTVIVTKDPKSISMTEEIFGPVMTVYVYEDADYEKTCELIDTTTDYALTGAIFGTDRTSLQRAAHLLRNSAGNFYINDKCTGAVVGQQPFGGARASGTNDKSGSISIFYRFIVSQAIILFLDRTCADMPSPLGRSRRTLSPLPSTTTHPICLTRNSAVTRWERGKGSRRSHIVACPFRSFMHHIVLYCKAVFHPSYDYSSAVS